MAIVLFALRRGAFLLSALGFMALLKDRTGLHSAFLPLVSLSSVGILLYTAGLCGILLPGTWVILGFGWAAFAFYAVLSLRKRFSFDFLLSPGCVFFCAASFLLIFPLWGAHLFHYDNFSHWGTVLSEMLEFNAFPDVRTVVNFRDYSPGSTAFLYGFCRLVGTGEDIALMGQAMLGVSALSALFCRVKKIRSWRFVTVCLLAVSLFSMMKYDDGTLHVFNLLVDALLGFLCVGGWMIREYYRDAPERAALFLIPVCAFLTTVKSNGILFAAFLWLFAAWDLFRTGEKKDFRRWLPLAGSVFLSLCYLEAWRVYRMVVYGQSTELLGFTGISDAVQGRTPQLYADIFSKLPQKLTDFRQGYVVIFLVLTVLTVALCLLLKRHGREFRFLRDRYWIGAGFFGVYLLFILFLYCFMMAPGEACYLAAFERYFTTPLIIFSALTADGMGECIARECADLRYSGRILSGVAGVILFFCVCVNASQLVCPPSFEASERGRVYPLLSAAAEVIPRNASVMMYNGEIGRRDLYYYLMLYQLKTRSCFDLDYQGQAHGLVGDLSQAKEYEYFLLAEEDDRILSDLAHAGYKVRWRAGCRIYRIEHDGDGGTALVPLSD